jgi:hypothetical protein
MGKQKVTPAIIKFIEANKTLNSSQLAKLLEKKRKIKLSYKTIDPYLQAARAEEQSANDAKIEAIRTHLLDESEKWGDKWLRLMSDEIEALEKLIKDADASGIKLENAKDRMAASQAVHRMLTLLTSFIKPKDDEINTQININLSWADDDPNNSTEPPSITETDS